MNLTQTDNAESIYGTEIFTWMNNDPQNYTWIDQAGGSGSQTYSYLVGDSFSMTNSYDCTSQQTWPATFWPLLADGTESSCGLGTNIGPPAIPFEHCEINTPTNMSMSPVWVNYGIASILESGFNDATYTRQAQTTFHFYAGGKSVPGQDLYLITVTASDMLSTNPVHLETITIAGHNLDTNGNVYALGPTSGEFAVTPQAPALKYYVFNVTVQHYPSYFTAYDEEPKPGGGRWGIITLWGFSAGHGWWCLSNGAPPEGLYQAGISYFNQEFLNRQVGYFSQIPIAAIIDVVPGILKVPGNAPRIDAKRQFRIGFNDLKNGLSFTASLAQNPGWYILWSTMYPPHHCVSTTIQAGAFSGVTLPNDKTPQNFGMDLNAMPNQ